MCRFQTVVQAYLSSSASLCVAEIRKSLFLHNFRCKLMCRPTRAPGPAHHCSAPLRQEVPRQSMFDGRAGLLAGTAAVDKMAGVQFTPRFTQFIAFLL